MYPIDLPVRLILLPGLGANHALFHAQKAVFGDALETPEFIEPLTTSESIKSYAQRWAPQLKSEAGDDRPVIVGGVSLGGLVALELAEAIDAKAVVLVSSARRDDGISLRARIADMLGKPVPLSLAPKVAMLMSLPFALVNEADDDDFALLKQMAADADPKVLKWGGGALADWESEGGWSLPVHQIHGSKDFILPPNGDADVEIRDGGHLINLTHAQTVNRFIADVAEQVAGVAPTPRL